MKHKPFSASWRGNTYNLVPDAPLDFQIESPDGRIARRPRLLEHDRGTEQQKQFKRKVRAYIAFLKQELTPVAFTAFAGEARIRRRARI